MRNYDEARVVRELDRRPGVKIGNGLIEVNKNDHNLGIKSWGKVDFLVHYCGYHLMITTRTLNGSKRIINEEDAFESKRKKSKSLMTKLVKNAMRK